MPDMSGIGGFGSGTSTTSAPIVMAVPAIETAFWIASLVTRVGSIIPVALRSTNLSGLLTSTPCPGLAFLSSANHNSELSPATSNFPRTSCS